jgi:putative ABC transport system ATP-binding protein
MGGSHCKGPCDPAEIVLTDESTANLDHKTGEGILQLMKEINGNFKTTFIFSTDDARVMAMVDRVVSIEDGQLTKEEVRDEKKHEITRAARRGETWVIEGGS